MQKSLIIIIILFFSINLKAQNSGLPDVVNNAFIEKFPKAKKVKWSNENIDDFQAEFSYDSLTESTLFSSKGEWQQTSINVPIPILSHLIVVDIKKKYPKQKMNKIVKIENNKKQIYYEIELKKNDELEYVNYDESGNEIKTLK